MVGTKAIAIAKARPYKKDHLKIEIQPSKSPIQISYGQILDLHCIG